MEKTKRSLLLLGLALVMAAFLAGCTDSEASKSARKTPPPPLVKAQTITRADVPLTLEYIGQAAGSREVEVRARVGGILLTRKYVEGSLVKKGDLLFTLDPEPFRAALGQARGQLAKAEAAFSQRKLDRDRTLKLYKDGVVSTQERDQALTAYLTGEADVLAAKAKVREAEINLGYTEVRAPITGITSQETRSEGSLVSTDAAGSLLTTITQLNPVYVNFSVPGTEAMRFRKLQAEGKLFLPKEYEVHIRLSDGSNYKLAGHINFADQQVDPLTGSIRTRAQFDNPDKIVLPGQFVRVLLDGSKFINTLAVPQRAVLFTQSGPIVYVLDEENTATPRPVVLGDSVGKEFVVNSGLEDGERIISEGVIKVRPGTVVKIAGETSNAPEAGK